MRKRNGFALTFSVFGIFLCLLFLGLAIDAGRMYVTKREIQAFCDESSVFAALQLDGTTSGLSRAANAASIGPVGSSSNRWDFGTKAVAAATVAFASAPAGPYQASPASGEGVRFVRVSALAAVPVHFLRLIPNSPGTATVKASATAGQFTRTSMGNGLDPFSPDAHDSLDPDFGFVRGQLYTLKWAPSGQRKTAFCAGDAQFDPGGSSDRGYLDVGQGTGDSALRASILDNSFFLPNPIVVGGPLPMMIPGENNTGEVMSERVAQDTDTASAKYSTYHGNGRRLVIVPINDHAPLNARVVGFAAFFLPINPCGSKNTDPCCAEYVGAGLSGSSHRAGAAGSGIYDVRILE